MTAIEYEEIRVDFAQPLEGVPPAMTRGGMGSTIYRVLTRFVLSRRGQRAPTNDRCPITWLRNCIQSDAEWSGMSVVQSSPHHGTLVESYR